MVQLELVACYACWGPQAEQEAFAAQTDKGMSEFVERVSMGGSMVMQGAGEPKETESV